MEKENNNKGVVFLLIVIIIILAVLCTLFATGTISFNKNTPNNEEKPQTSETSDNDLVTKLVGTYSYKGKYVDNEQEITTDTPIKEMIYDKLVLESSGNATAEAGNVRGGGYSAKGKWYISKDEIIILNENCGPVIMENEIVYPNCSELWKYKYEVENDSITITSINNTMEAIILNKEA